MTYFYNSKLAKIKKKCYFWIFYWNLKDTVKQYIDMILSLILECLLLCNRMARILRITLTSKFSKSCKVFAIQIQFVVMELSTYSSSADPEEFTLRHKVLQLSLKFIYFFILNILRYPYVDSKLVRNWMSGLSSARRTRSSVSGWHKWKVKYLKMVTSS